MLTDREDESLAAMLDSVSQLQLLLQDMLQKTPPADLSSGAGSDASTTIPPLPPAP